MSEMVAERAENPKYVGMKLGSRGLWVERMSKEEEKRATGASPQEWFPI
jgi:hypothetical protein